MKRTLIVTTVVLALIAAWLLLAPPEIQVSYRSTNTLNGEPVDGVLGALVGGFGLISSLLAAMFAMLISVFVVFGVGYVVAGAFVIVGLAFVFVGLPVLAPLVVVAGLAWALLRRSEPSARAT